jgi:hypothetical protein
MGDWTNRVLSRSTATLIVVATVVIIGIHYILFVDSINRDRECRGQYNKEVLEATVALSVWVKDSYDNQNRLTVEYAAATARQVPERTDVEFISDVQDVFAAHYERLAVLDERFKQIQIPELPSCFT